MENKLLVTLFAFSYLLIFTAAKSDSGRVQSGLLFVVLHARQSAALSHATLRVFLFFCFMGK